MHSLLQEAHADASVPRTLLRLEIQHRNTQILYLLIIHNAGNLNLFVARNDSIFIISVIRYGLA